VRAQPQSGSETIDNLCPHKIPIVQTSINFDTSVINGLSNRTVYNFPHGAAIPTQWGNLSRLDIKSYIV
jgi:hypothetical protein